MMNKKEIKRAVVAEVINMLHNDIIEENGTEPFLGWLADGEVFELDGYNDEEVKELMAFAENISLEVDKLVWQIESGGEI